MKRDDRWREADQWLERALEVPPNQRKALLDECTDEELRDEVLKLVELAERSDGVFAPGSPIALWDEAEVREAFGLESGFDAGHRLLDRYELEEKIGQGAMGAVFRARDAKLERKVAVKVLSEASLDSTARERLLREARAAAALNHPNIVAIHDVGEEDGQPFFVMELVEGTSLEASPPTGVAAIVSTARQICAALAHAHARGIVHRDLKPGNVLVVPTEGGHTLKLVDLGLALGRDRSRVTAAGHVVGTPSYMAPEQALGRDVDARTDLYALGIMMYQWATGELPFAGDDPLAIVSQHINVNVVPPRERAPDVPAELDAIIVRLLAKEPAERFESAAELATVLAALEGTADSLETLEVLSATPKSGNRREPTAEWQRIWRRLTGASRLPPLMGRESALATIATAVDRLTQSEPDEAGSVLLMAGEPGTGKTRLVAEIVERAGKAGAFVLAGTASELSSRLPYAPFVDAWVEHVETANGPVSENPFGSFEPVPGQIQESTLKVFRAFESAVFRSSGNGPAVIIVEDLHWADDSTLRLFHELHVRTATRPLLLVGTYRESDLTTGSTLHSLLINLNRQRRVQRIRLEPLSASETYAQIEALAEGDSSTSFAKRVYEMSEGNPLFTEELVLDALERGGPTGSVAIPESLSAVIEERVARLGKLAKTLLRAASVTGESFRFEWARAASGLHESEAVDALETALRSRLLEEEGPRYRFRHALVREAIYAGLSRERVKALHGAIADAIRDTELQVDRSERDRLLAHHYQAAGRPLEALPHLLAAGEFAMSRTGFEETRVLYETALAIMDAHGETSGERRYRLLSALGSIDLALSNLDASRSYFEAAAALPPAEEGWSLKPERRARMLRMAAVALMTAGDLVRVDELLSDALELLPEVSRERPQVLYHLAQLRWSEGKHEETYELAERVLAEAEKADDSEGLAKGYEMLALACHSMGAWREGIEFVEKRKEIVGDAVDVAQTFDAHL